MARNVTILTPSYPQVKVKEMPGGFVWQVLVEGRTRQTGRAAKFIDAQRAGELAAAQEWDRVTAAYDSLNEQRLDP